MENEPEKPKSSVPPPPDLPPPSLPPKPDVPPPPPPVEPPSKPATVAAPPPVETAPGEDHQVSAPGKEAGFDTRVVAAIIDGFVAGGISWVVGLIADPLGMLAACAYLLVRDALPPLEGQSIGKKIMKIKAVTLEGKSLSGDWQTSVVRNLLVGIPPFALLEAFILFSRKDKDVPLRRFGDEWAKTKVVVAAEPSPL